MEEKRRKTKTDDQNNVIKLKHEYWRNVFTHIVDILKNTGKLDKFIITIEYVVDEFKDRQYKLRRSKYFDTQGKFPTPILSFELHERIISLTANNVMTQMKRELGVAMYYSITIDSVPDTDESAIYIRYVDYKGIPKKRFLEIINKRGDDDLQLMDILHVTLDKYNLSHNGFMGLSYKMDSNILKHRASLKSSIKSINRFAEIVPCSSDPLSLVFIKTANSCYECSVFFKTLDELLNFFLILQDKWFDVKFLLKNMPYDKFSSKKKIVKRLYKNWSMMVYAFLHISENMSFSENIRTKAYMLLQKVKRLETCFMTIFWKDISEKIIEQEENLLKYVSTEIDFLKIFEIYESLINYLNIFRTNETFMNYKTRAFQISNILHFNNRDRIEKPQMRFPANYTDEDDNFKIKTYFYMIDEIQTELNYRKDIYQDLTSKFNFLNKIPTLTDGELNLAIENLQAIYLEYIDYHISTECDRLKNILHNIQRNLTSIKHISTLIPANMFFFEQLTKVVQIVLCIAATNCKVEHSDLSVLNKVITSLKSKMSEDTYNSLLIINMGQEVLKYIDFKSVIEDFARNQSTASL